MQSALIHYVQPVSFYSFLYVFTFHLFSNISKTVFETSHTWFCREFQALSFNKKRVLIKGIIEEKYSKYKQSNLFWNTRYNDISSLIIAGYSRWCRQSYCLIVEGLKMIVRIFEDMVMKMT
jgi:hypothetical protein